MMIGITYARVLQGDDSMLTSYTRSLKFLVVATNCFIAGYRPAVTGERPGEQVVGTKSITAGLQPDLFICMDAKHGRNMQLNNSCK